MSSACAVMAELTCLTPGSVRTLRTDFPAMTFLWCDLDGAHCGPAPDSATGATHLWGWQADASLLARLERSEIVAGALLRRSVNGIAVTVRPLHLWKEGEHRVHELPQGLRGQARVTLEVAGPLELLGDRSWNT